MEKLPSAYKQVGPNRYREAYGLFYEDFTPGDVFEHRPGRTLTETDNIYMTLLAMNTHPLHFDSAYANATQWKRPLMNSLVTISVVTGMSVHSTSQNAVANLGWDKVRLVNPVFAGDTLYAETTVVSKRESESRPTQGSGHRAYGRDEGRRANRAVGNRGDRIRPHLPGLQARTFTAGQG